MPPDPRIVRRDDEIPPVLQEDFAGPGGVREPRLFYRKNFGKLRSEERLTKKSAGSGRRSGGAPGDRIGDLTEIRDGFFRQYVNGRIYFRSGLTACHVLGAIGDRYSLYGGPGGWLGWPTSDELPFDGGAVSRFQNGAIYWWPDTGPIPLGDVIVRYTGLACFGETMVTEALSSSDEPYVIFCTTPAVPVTPSTVRTRIYGGDDDEYGGVDQGDSRLDNIELYRGLPHGLSLTRCSVSTVPATRTHCATRSGTPSRGESTRSVRPTNARGARWTPASIPR